MGEMLSCATKKRRDFRFQPTSSSLGFQRTLPDGDDMPTELAECVFKTEVAGAVAFDLVPPPFSPALGNAEEGTMLLPVPETAVDEDDAAVLRQDEVGFSGQGAVERAVHGEAVAEAVEH